MPWGNTPQISYGTAKARFNVDGGMMVRLLNKTGATSVRGHLIEAHPSVDLAVALTPASAVDCIGSIWEVGRSDGELVWCVVNGIAQVMLKDTTGSTAGNWVQTSDVIGRADASLASPAAAPQHFREIGHSLQTVGGGSDVLCWMCMHQL